MRHGVPAGNGLLITPIDLFRKGTYPSPVKTCYLHIGPPKTATTTLQTFLLRHETALEQSGLLFPKLGDLKLETRHHPLAYEFANDARHEYRSMLRQELKRTGWVSSIVLSSEAFSLAINRMDVRDRLFSFFSELGYVIKIIAYVRPQLLRVNSLYTQRTKSLRIGLTFDEFIARFIRAETSDFMLQFGPVLHDKRFSSCFAPFNESVVANGICNDFRSRLDLKDEGAQDFAADLHRNVSPGPKTVAAIGRIVRTLYKPLKAIDDQNRSMIASALLTITKKKGWDEEKFNGLNRSHKAMILERFRTSNDNFARLAWSRHWQEVFGQDEETAMRQPPNIFRPKFAAPEERQDFSDFVRFGQGFAQQVLDDSDKRPTSQA